MYRSVRAPTFYSVSLYQIRLHSYCDQWIQNTIVSATVLQYVTNNIISGAYPFLRQICRTYLVVYFLGHCHNLPQEPCSDVAMYSLLDLSYARWLSAEPEVVRCRWTVVLRRCRDARSRRAAPHDLATSHDQFSVARSLPRWTSRRARCFHALTTLLPRCFHSN